MATLTIRQLDDRLYEQLKTRAASNHRSLEAEVRHRLEQSMKVADGSTRNWAEEFRRVAMDPGPDYEGSVALIRSIRDEE